MTPSIAVASLLGNSSFYSFWSICRFELPPTNIRWKFSPFPLQLAFGYLCLLIHKRKERLDSCRTGAAMDRWIMYFSKVSAEFAQHHAEIHKESENARDATDDKESPEAVQMEFARVILRSLWTANVFVQPLVVDLLKLTIFWQCENGSRQVNG